MAAHFLAHGSELSLRDRFKAAEAMLDKSGVPLVAAVEDYLRARELAGESLAAMAAEYGQH